MNQIFSYPGQPQMQVEVIKASQPASRKTRADPLAVDAPPIFTLRLRYPRIIHAEVETHRVIYNQGTVVEIYESGLGIMADDDLSRNARSSRAVPVKTLLEEVRKTPFIPWHWGKNQRGMQAGAESNEPVLIPDWDDVDFHGKPHLRSHTREQAWIEARECALNVATAFDTAGYHKQIVNRLLEPFMWIDTLVTSTEWANFLWLRNHEAAEPHLQDLARLIGQAIGQTISEGGIETLEPGQWHLPYITNDDWRAATPELQKGRIIRSMPSMQEIYMWLCKISAARCARISYAPFDGDASYERELERYNLLVSSDRVHASPLEHQATPDVMFTGQELGQFPPEPGWENPELHGNLNGYIQYRKMVPNENHNGA